MASVKVNLIEQGEDGYSFEVNVTDRGGSSTTHRVSVRQSDYKDWTGDKISPADLVEESFKFLLKREPKESILRQFDLSEIPRYFPEYIEEVKNFK